MTSQHVSKRQLPVTQRRGVLSYKKALFEGGESFWNPVTICICFYELLLTYVGIVIFYNRLKVLHWDQWRLSECVRQLMHFVSIGILAHVVNVDPTRGNLVTGCHVSVSGGPSVLATQLSAGHLPEVLGNVHAFQIPVVCGISDDCRQFHCACLLHADLFTSLVRSRGLRGLAWMLIRVQSLLRQIIPVGWMKNGIQWRLSTLSWMNNGMQWRLSTLSWMTIGMQWWQSILSWMTNGMQWRLSTLSWMPNGTQWRLSTQS